MSALLVIVDDFDIVRASAGASTGVDGLDARQGSHLRAAHQSMKSTAARA